MAGKYLLDTHAFLWATSDMSGVSKLGGHAKEAIADMESALFVSSISLFEISYKYRNGKLPEYKAIAENVFAALYGLGAEELLLNWIHAQLAGCLDWPHKDPFDRMLAAQAQTEGLTLITCDGAFDTAPSLSTLW